MWCSRRTHKTWLPSRSSLGALRPRPQLPLWSVMGLLRSASSILITGQNPLNGIWFAMKGRGRAVSHWTRLSLETYTPLHPPVSIHLFVEAAVFVFVCACQREAKRQSSSTMRGTVCGLSKLSPSTLWVLTDSRDGSATQLLRSWEENTEERRPRFELGVYPLCWSRGYCGQRKSLIKS